MPSVKTERGKTRQAYSKNQINKRLSGEKRCKIYFTTKRRDLFYVHKCNFERKSVHK